jgi:CHASE2 domain-containing sensor protein
MTLLVEIALLGPAMGVMSGMLCILASAALVEALLFTSERIPFTSSYLPGRKQLVDVVIGYVLAAILYVSSLAALIGWCAQSPIRAFVLLAILLLICFGLRRARRGAHEIHRLEFEELPEPVVETLSIDRD